MKNTAIDKIYHWYVSKRYSMQTFRGSWMLTRLFINDYKWGGVRKFLKIYKAHKAGFCYSDFIMLDIENRTDKFLTTRDYCSLHPLNGVFSAWIDDKLTLKYILNGTELQHYMPDYYFQIDTPCCILPLTDCPVKYSEASIESIIKLLEDKKRLAFKKIKASLGIGFIKAEFNEEESIYKLNGEKYNYQELNEELHKLKDYLVMELLEPHPQFTKYSSESIGCLRYLIGRRLSGKVVEIISYMRLGTKRSGSVENYNAGGILTYVRDGDFKGGHIHDVETNTDMKVEKHPDTGELIEGNIPKWSEIKSVAFKVAQLLPQMNYMGFDFCVTNDDKIKILEINSLTSLDAMQLEESVYDMPQGDFFKERLGLL